MIWPFISRLRYERELAAKERDMAALEGALNELRFTLRVERAQRRVAQSQLLRVMSGYRLFADPKTSGQARIVPKPNYEPKVMGEMTERELNAHFTEEAVAVLQDRSPHKLMEYVERRKREFRNGEIEPITANIPESAAAMALSAEERRAQVARDMAAAEEEGRRQ